MPTSRTPLMMDPRRLYPHPQNDRIYGKPQDNDQFDRMVREMKKDGYDTEYPLIVTSDKRVLAGCTRHAAALAAKLKEVPCLLFTPRDPERRRTSTRNNYSGTTSIAPRRSTWSPGNGSCLWTLRRSWPGSGWQRVRLMTKDHRKRPTGWKPLQGGRQDRGTLSQGPRRH